MRDPWEHAALAQMFSTHERTALPRAPLQSRLSGIIARHAAMSSLLAHAPPEQRTPVLLLAAIHDRVLSDPGHPLAAWYPTVRDHPNPPEDPGLVDALRDFVDSRSHELIALVADRHVQTNEVARTALLAAGLGDQEERLAGRPIVHVDVGSSAGLTLLFDRLRYRFEHDDGRTTRLATETSTADTLEITTGVTGTLALPQRLPAVADRIGLDLRPVDLDDADRRRWLEACVWPDQIDRMQRLRQAIGLASADPPRQVRGDAVDDLEQTVDGIGSDAVPMISTTWVLNYLSTERQRAFVQALDRIGAGRDLVWVAAESPFQTPGLPHETSLDDEQRTALLRATWIDGRRRIDHVGLAHPHGYWIRTAHRAA